MFDRFSDGARNTMAAARKAATRLGHDFIGTEHILLGLLDSGENKATAALTRLGVDLAPLRRAVEERAPPGDRAVASGQLPFTPMAKRALELAMIIARALGDDHVGGEHLVLGLLAEGKGIAAEALKKSMPIGWGANQGEIAATLEKTMSHAAEMLGEMQVMHYSLAMLEGIVRLLPARLAVSEDLLRARDSLAREIRESRILPEDP